MNDPKKIISLSAAGLDSPGLVSKITQRIFELGGNIIDVEENCRKGLFAIFLIIDFSSSDQPLPDVTKALKALETETNLKVMLGVHDKQEIAYTPEKETHLVTVLGLDKPGIIARISRLFLEYNINIENCRMIARGRFFSMEMVIDTGRMIVDPSLSHEEAVEKMKGSLKSLCRELHQSVVIQSEDIYSRAKKLVVFDVESTLIQDHSLRDFLEKAAGGPPAPEGPLLQSERGEAHLQALIENALTLRGLALRDFERFSEILQLNPGSVELIRILKSMGFKIALLSSGFSFFIKRILEEAGVDYAFSNTLKVDEAGMITGELEEPIITGETKEEILEFILDVEGISRDQVIAVGGGSTRSHFIRNAGLSIAFKPDETSVATDGILSTDQITNILYCLGIPKAELEKYFRSGDHP